MRNRECISLSEMPNCQSCGRPRDNERCRNCGACREKMRKKNNARYRRLRDQRLALDLCPECGWRPAFKGGRCKPCRAKAAEVRRKILRERKEQGCCLRCGKKLTEAVRLCEDCRKKKNAESRKFIKKRYHNWREARLCPVCGGPRDREGYICCSACSKKIADRQREKREALAGQA